MDPRGTVGRMYKEDHYTLLHTKSQNMKALGLVVSEKKIFLCFSHCKSMGANDPPGRGHFGPQGHDWQDLYRGPLNIATHKI